MKRLLLLMFTLVSFLSVDVFAAMTVKSVSGKVSYKKGRIWKPVTKGMELSEGTKISTGVHGRSRINIDGHILRVRPLTMLKLYRARFNGKSSVTKIGLRRGSVRAKIHKRRKVRTIFKIATPIATSSVRGTEEVVSFGPGRGMGIDVISGRIESNTKNGVHQFISGRSKFRMKGGEPKPKELLDKSKNKAMNIFHDGASTRGERGRMGRHGGEVIDVAREILDDPAIKRILDNIPVNVDITINFPVIPQ